MNAPWRDASGAKQLIRARPWKALLARAWWRVRRVPARLQPHSAYFQRTSTYFSEPLTMVLWGCACLVLIAALAAFGILVGRGATGLHAAAGLRHAASLVTKPAVAAPIAILISIAFGWCLRGARLAWLAWRPGPIIVADFTMAREIPGVSPALLTALFRDGLSLLRLDSAAASPGAAPEQSFLDVLGSVQGSSSSFLSVLLTLLRASLPTHTFEIHGLIQQRDEPQPCGITVHVVRLPGKAAGLVEVWDTTWEGAARQAADGAVAALLPRTRCCRGPWATWQRFAAPGALFTAYREAADLEQHRRYDEALGRYHDALGLDPTNLTVRLHLGQLQEKIGHLIGALATYQRILALNNPGGRAVPRGLYRRAARHEWERVVRIAKYRQIVLLGEGSLAREWCGDFDDEPAGYRRGLRVQFRAVLEPLTQRRGDPAADIISDAIAKLVAIKQPEDEGVPWVAESESTVLARLQLELVPFAYRAAYELQRSLSRLELRPWLRDLSRRTVGLTLACLRVRAVVARQAGAAGKPIDGDELLRALNRDVRSAGLRPFPWFGWRPPMFRRWTWQQHYNAACLFAIPLAVAADAKLAPQRPGADHVGVLDEPTSAELARRAVHRLERAAARAGYEFAATRRDWVLHEDPDLRALRGRPEFEAFARQYFPDRFDTAPWTDGPLPVPGAGAGAGAGAGQAGPPGPPAPALAGQPAPALAGQPGHAAQRSRARLAENEYAHGLLVATSTCWHDLWHQRACQQPVSDAHTLLRWWQEESQVWTLFAAVASAPYEWPRRQKLLGEANALAMRDGIKPVIATYRPSGALARAAGAAYGPGVPAGDAPAAQPEARLTAVGLEFAPTGALLSTHDADFRTRLELLRRADAEALSPISPAQAELLCRRQAAVWQALADWLAGEVVRDGAPDDAEALKRVHHHLSAIDAIWHDAGHCSRPRYSRRLAAHALVSLSRVLHRNGFAGPRAKPPIR